MCKIEIDTLERSGPGPGGCLDGGGTVPPSVVPQPPGLSPLHPDVITPKRQAVVDRLRRRIESYRRRQSDCMPRFDQTFTGLCEQNLQDTLQLKQRYLDTKNKRTPKSKDKKQQDSTALQSSVHVQQKFLKRPSEDHDSGVPGDGFEPPVKLQCTTQHGAAHQPEGLTKFSVEIVQQLEFTTSAANSQPQQISTNVTVKALTNASVKSDVSSPKSSNPSTPASNLRPSSGVGNSVDIGTLVECVKQEPDNDFADLDQCAAALEKDAAVNGTAFGGFSDLIGEDPDDEIITSDAFKDLISDISNYPEFMKDFDFDENKSENSLFVNGLKVEESKEITQNVLDNSKNSQNTHSPLLQNTNYSPPIFEGQGSMSKNRMSYSNMDFGKTELSPAAQTLKQMAEQHQHKNQMGLTFNPNTRAPNPRSPYPDFQFQGDYGSPNSNSNFKNSPNFNQPEMIKQEMMYQGTEYDMKRKGAGIYKQQYSPYGSPSASSHGSPGYLPRTSGGGGSTPGGGAFGGGTPPRPASGPGGNTSGTTLQINQAQQLHISQQGQGHSIQVSAGQHLQLSGDLKGNVSIATQQGMYFNQQSATNAQQNSSSQQQTCNTTNSQQPNSVNQQQGGPGGLSNQTNSQSQNVQQGVHLSNSQLSNAQAASQQHTQGPYGNMGDLHGASLSGGGGGGMAGPGVNMLGGGGMGGPGVLPISSGHGVGMPGSQHQSAMGDMYSMSQTQTINFTQQSLRQRVNGPNGMPSSMGPNSQMAPNGLMSNNVTMGPGGPMGSGGPMGNTMGPRHMAPQTLEQQKLLQQQQQMLRAQQALMQQQMVRPPPPEYKASAGMMQTMQPRYPTGPPTSRRMPQPMPPSGPMMRSHNMYVMQQQHLSARTMYPRQQSPISGPESIPQHGSAEWRHLIMTQQQNANFNPQIRPNFQHQAGGYGMNTGNMQMTGIQHQQMRTQGMVSTGMQGQNMSQPQGLGQNPMQMNNINQQMLSHMQQQQAIMQQQSSNQMSLSNMSMQQTQSLSMTNQSIQHQQLNNHQQLLNNPSNNNQSNSLSNFNPQAADFNLDFLENLPTSDTSAFSEQELLNSFDNDPGFNLHDML
ncbi:hypothetical protein RN001_006332 [Aquatica leii]|uniref:Neurogenic mastermind-like N-terminal domain-containing protein n=1 Tax=Aquatica leii TaxID=1421715 RepID=A0AAN7PDY8_9COLE|nr:hypothetical protein RN001_006332 [Aquatica leii]